MVSDTFLANASAVRTQIVYQTRRGSLAITVLITKRKREREGSGYIVFNLTVILNTEISANEI